MTTFQAINPRSNATLLAASIGIVILVAVSIAVLQIPELLAIATATLVSEDLTCITTGLLVRGGNLDGLQGIAACVIGIYGGDLALFLLGRSAGKRMLKWPWLQRRLTSDRATALADWFDANPGKSVFISRFTPGLRLPGYFAAGAFGRRPLAFAVWTLLAVVVWTPMLILLVAAFGETLADPLRTFFGTGWRSLLPTLAAIFFLMRLLATLASPITRARLLARISLVWRWEFWPSWLFYLPLIPYLLWLGARHRGLLTITATNPGMPHSGFVGESKHEILEKLDSRFALAHFLVPPATIPIRCKMLKNALENKVFCFPLIFKPDAGQRGAGVRIIHSMDQAEQYFAGHAGATIVQTYHPGPFEAGIFYYRLPGESRGKIFSVTDKEFPVLIGDGRSTLHDLIWTHTRFRMQAPRFLARHALQANRVLARNERFLLAAAGNHCQGTLFRDGEHLITPELEHAIDTASQRFEGFHFGRFDVRYSDVQAFREGRDFAIIELNGVTSESTNIYDPKRSLLMAYRTLAQQWALAFVIGDANRLRGAQVSTWRELFHEVRGHYSEPSRDLLAD